jgi:hypothetical protein
MAPSEPPPPSVLDCQSYRKRQRKKTNRVFGAPSGSTRRELGSNPPGSRTVHLERPPGMCSRRAFVAFCLACLFGKLGVCAVKLSIISPVRESFQSGADSLFGFPPYGSKMSGEYPSMPRFEVRQLILDPNYQDAWCGLMVRHMGATRRTIRCMLGETSCE